MHEWVRLDKPPEALAERANQIVNKLGYTDAPTDTVYSFGYDGSYLNYARQDAAPDRFEKIRTGQPVTLYFWYRTSPRYLVPNAGGEVSFFDPPNDVSGMTSVALDVRGRLIEFQAVPPQVEEKATPNIPTDWSTLFAEAGLDIRHYKEIESQWTPPFYADERKAWEGTQIDHAKIPVRIEAAAFQGKPVYFNVISPWDKPWRQTDFRTSAGFTGIILAITFFSLLLAALIVARHNLKAGRGDTKGAFKLAVFVFSVITLARLIDASHVPELGGEFWIFFQSVSLALSIAALTWIFYIALEPFLRRRWSELLISWSRLMAGDFRDPLVGRDILVGASLGLCFTATYYLAVLVQQWSGVVVAPIMEGSNEEGFSGVGGMAVHFLHGFAELVFITLLLSFLLLLLLSVLRKKWLAIAAMWLIMFLHGINSMGSDQWISWLNLLLPTTFLILAAARFGMLALYAFFLAAGMSNNFPMTSDFSSWYAGSTLFVFVVIMSLAIYGFYTSLAGQKIFEANFLKDVET